MKYNINYRLKYKNKRIDKSINIDKVIDLTHAKKILTTHLRVKHPKMINYEIINVKNIGI